MIYALEDGYEVAFLSTPSGWRATKRIYKSFTATTNFYPRPPGGGRPVEVRADGTEDIISIHALRVEGDAVAALRDIE